MAAGYGFSAKQTLCIFVVCQSLAAGSLVFNPVTASTADISSVAAPDGTDAEKFAFNIKAMVLPDALQEFSRQSRLQIVFRPEQVPPVLAPAIADSLTAGLALQQLLGDTGLVWTYVNDNTILVRQPPQAVAVAAAKSEPAPVTEDPDVDDLHMINMLITSGRLSQPGTLISSAGFGIQRPLYELPRSITVLNPEYIDLADVSVVDDLLRLTPGVFTPARFGVQGAVDIRNSPADVYFRGMKRINLEGHGRSVLGAADTIEIVRGPPSPLYGMGKPGGYTNVDPRSARARAGAQLNATQGYIEARTGSFDKAEFSLGAGGPLSMLSKTGGFYAYGLLEDSGSYVRHVDVAHRVLQLAISLDEVLPGIRLESGLYHQHSDTSGALMNRATQELVDSGLYVRGQPLVDLDSNRSGNIGFYEMYKASPVSGTLSANNLPLIQVWAWPTDSSGQYLIPAQFPAIRGIPQTLFDYLEANPESDPGGFLRSQGVGGPLPVSGSVPVGFALDPRTTGKSVVDPRQPGSYEKQIEADFDVFYMDLISDADPNRIVQNQFFMDRMDQFKLSEQPGGGKQDVLIAEDRLSIRLSEISLPDDRSLTLVGSANLRYTRASGYRYVGDQGSHRRDASSLQSWNSPATRFVHAFDNNDLNSDGAPWVSNYKTVNFESGLGLLAELTWDSSTRLLLGGRIDWSSASNTEFAGTIDVTRTQGRVPGVTRENDQSARGEDSGGSYSVSVIRDLPLGLIAYGTRSSSSLLLDNNNNRISNDVIDQGHIGDAGLSEFGLRGVYPDAGVLFSVAIFNQNRTDGRDDEQLITPAYLMPTETRGWEAELSWQASHNWLLSLYATRHVTHFKPNRGALVLVDARTLGFQDVVDDHGNVVYPAEAFLYGGRSFIRLPENLESFSRRQAYPEYQKGLLLAWRPTDQWQFSLYGNYYSSTHSGRLQQIRLPSSIVTGFGAQHQKGVWQLRIDFNNLSDDEWYRARSGDNLGETLLSAMPGRNWRLGLRFSF